jgi:hypothetical protein
VVDDSDRQPVVGRDGRHLKRAAAGTASAPPALTLEAMRQLIADELTHPTTAVEAAP